MFKLITLLKEHKMSCVNVEFIGKWIKCCKDSCLIDVFDNETNIALVISGAGVVLDKEKIEDVTYENGCINIVSKTNEKIILKKC